MRPERRDRAAARARRGRPARPAAAGPDAARRPGRCSQSADRDPDARDARASRSRSSTATRSSCASRRRPRRHRRPAARRARCSRSSARRRSARTPDAGAAGASRGRYRAARGAQAPHRQTALRRRRTRALAPGGPPGSAPPTARPFVLRTAVRRATANRSRRARWRANPRDAGSETPATGPPGTAVHPSVARNPPFGGPLRGLRAFSRHVFPPMHQIGATVKLSARVGTTPPGRIPATTSYDGDPARGHDIPRRSGTRGPPGCSARSCVTALAVCGASPRPPSPTARSPPASAPPTRGQVVTAGNTVLTCPGTSTACQNAQNGTTAAADNNDFDMSYVRRRRRVHDVQLEPRDAGAPGRVDRPLRRPLLGRRHVGGR